MSSITTESIRMSKRTLPVFLRNAQQFVVQAITFTFLTFLFLVMSFGRSFCVTRIETPLSPIFITEVMLVVGSVLVLLRFKDLKGLSKSFLVLSIGYFLFGSFYFIKAISEGYLLALRDIVYFAYVLFFFISYLLFLSRENLKMLLLTVVASNVVGIIFGRCFLISPDQLPVFELRLLASQAKAVHFGLFYSIAACYMLACYNLVQKRVYKFGILLLIVLNIYLVFVLAQRTIWFAFLSGLFLLVLLMRKEILKVLVRALPLVVLLGGILYYFDYEKVNTRMPTVDLHKTMAKKMSPNVQLAKMTSLVRGINILISESTAMVQDGFTPSNYASKAEPLDVNASPMKKSLRIDDPMNYLNELVRKAKTKVKGETLSDSSAHSIFWRFEIWTEFIGYTLQCNPFLGVGFGKYPAAYENIAIGSTYDQRSLATPFLLHHEQQDVAMWKMRAHNHLVSVFYKMGLVGLILFVLLIGQTFWLGLRFISNGNADVFARSFMVSAVASLVVWNVAAFFFDLIDSPPSSLMLWVFIGLIHSSLRFEQGDFI